MNLNLTIAEWISPAAETSFEAAEQFWFNGLPVEVLASVSATPESPQSNPEPQPGGSISPHGPPVLRRLLGEIRSYPDRLRGRGHLLVTASGDMSAPSATAAGAGHLVATAVADLVSAADVVEIASVLYDDNADAAAAIAALLPHIKRRLH